MKLSAAASIQLAQRRRAALRPAPCGTLPRAPELLSVLRHPLLTSLLCTLPLFLITGLQVQEI